MGCTVRDKHIRTNRRTRPARPEPEDSNSNGNEDKSGTAKQGGVGGHTAIGVTLRSNPMRVSDSNQVPDYVFDENGWGYCTEEQLEEILLKNLEFLYNEAVDKLVALGYDEDVALKAVLRNGHCYGGMDMLTNVLHNSLAYLNGGGNNDEDGDGYGSGFTDLRQVEEYALTGMVCLLQHLKPQLSKGDAMWCLLMSDLHLGRASVMEIPVMSGNSNGKDSSTARVSGNLESVVSDESPVGVNPALCRFHGGWGFGNGGTSEFPMMGGVNGFLSYSSEFALQKEIDCPKRFNLSPSMKSMLRRNVAMFAAGFRANSKQFHGQSQACPSSLSAGDSTNGGGNNGGGATIGNCEPSKEEVSQNVVNSVMTKFQELNLDENTEQGSLDQKDEMILGLVRQIKDLEKQVKERKDWAHQKAMQAARKLSNDLTELKMLRMEREETQRLKKGKDVVEDGSVTKVKEMEEALRTASGQVDRANVAIRRLECENAEIRAEMEASKLSASESVKTSLEVAKREKKCLKKLLAWEKQKTKMQEDITAEKQKLVDLNKELAQEEEAIKVAETKWRQEQKVKEQVLVQLEEERRIKEACEANNKRKLEALRLKIEIDFQRHKDDLLRLEQEHARLKESAQSTEIERQFNSTNNNNINHNNNLWAENLNGMDPQEETIARLLNELDLDESSANEAVCDRECMLCKKDEVSIVFLPCAHQVLCAGCNESYGKKGRALCPCCRVPIEQRIRVYGASS